MKALVREIWNEWFAKPKNITGSHQLSPGGLNKIVEKHLGKEGCPYKLTEDEKLWWNTLDLRDDYLCKLWSSMFGTTEQRIKQLYLVKNNHNFLIHRSHENL